MNKPIYIHYGHNEYKTPNPIVNERNWTKPKGGLWASRKDDDFGWKDWCKNEDFRMSSFDSFFEFVLKDQARVLTLHDVDQLDNLPKTNHPDRPYIKHDAYSECCLDFEKLTKEYDAVELINVNQFYYALYGWDCNSILIMNPNIIEIVKESKENV